MPGSSSHLRPPPLLPPVRVIGFPSSDLSHPQPLPIFKHAGCCGKRVVSITEKGEQSGDHQHSLARRGDAWTRTRGRPYRWGRTAVCQKTSCPRISPLRETPQGSSADPWLLNLAPCPYEAAHLWSFFGGGPPRTEDGCVHLTGGYLPSWGSCV